MLTQLEADRARVTDIEAQILHLEHSLCALRIEESLAQEQPDSYTYPVLTLPNEIVSEIFVHFLPTYPLFPPFTGILSPTILTQICRKWREIALGIPALWSVMSDDIDTDIPFALRSHAFNIWLERSRSCPLSLQFRLGGRGVPDITAAVVPHRARWERLKLYSLYSSHLSILDGPMPMLRYLDLGFGSVGTEAVVFEAPLLRTVLLNDGAASQVILPWAQLTSLTLSYFYPHECVPILQQTSNLVRCELHIVSFGSDSNQPGPDLSLPYLESLTLIHLDEDPATGFIETFIVPALRSLEIPEQYLDADPIESLKRFISKSGCKLEELRITGQRTRPQHSYRQAFPWIRNFSFNDERTDEQGPSDVEASS